MSESTPSVSKGASGSTEPSGNLAVCSIRSTSQESASPSAAPSWAVPSFSEPGSVTAVLPE